jgi:glyoxylase-like metal-dependent hydrolase (beta-lactamase superfamily II)
MKITDAIHQLQIDFEITISPETKIPRFVNVLIIFGETITLVDTGIKNSETIIFDYIKKHGRNYTEINTIILSHSHPDHIGSAAKIKELTNCKVLAHKLEQEWIEDIELQNKQRPVPGFYNLVDTPVLVDEFLENGQSLKISDDVTVKCIHTPGHSKGMLCLNFIEDKILFTADAIPLKGDIPNYDNFLELEKSLKTIKNMGFYNTLLASWAPEMTDTNKIFQVIHEGEAYLKKLDNAVKKHYISSNIGSLESCQACIQELGLPPFLVNPIVDKAFRSHLK